MGYVLDLAKDTSQDWFHLACDLAIRGIRTTPDEYTRASLMAMCRGQAGYLRSAPGVPPAATPATPSPVNRLEELYGFTHFKRLSPSLALRFCRRITIVFGCNGSGKSSACDALKVLARTEGPERPIDNAHNPAGQPSFSYKFQNDSVAQTWTYPDPFGVRRDLVKYFDSTIATRNITTAVEPGRLVVLAPFQLQVFELLKSLVDEVREALRKQQAANTLLLESTLGEINAAFVDFKGRSLNTLSTRTIGNLSGEISLGEAFNQEEELTSKRALLAEVRKSGSDDGLALIRAEQRELEELIEVLRGIADGADALWAAEPVQKAADLRAKLDLQQALTQSIVPEGQSLNEFKQLLVAAGALLDLTNPAGKTCPLCRHPLGTPDEALFAQYHELISGLLEQEISALKADIRTATDSAQNVALLAAKNVDGLLTVGQQTLDLAKTLGSQVSAGCLMDSSPTKIHRTSLQSLRKLIDSLTKLQAAKTEAIRVAKDGKSELDKKEAALLAELEPLEYANAVKDRLALLRTARELSDEASELSASLQPFTNLLRKITEASKTAHEELVVGDFTARLDEEYKKLTERDMAHFGVGLMRTGSEVVVTVRPHIGQCGIQEVLSEGELRVHALALFFAESLTCSESVFVFDDPVSSFDYDYTANYCERVRDLAKGQPDRQIIVLTHNWEFFVQLQNTLNKAHLNDELSVQVLENCCTVGEYSEKIDELKAEVSQVLGVTAEPDKATKERMAGNMRRLIESIVNKHVFRGQRQQYKQRSHSVSNFAALTGLVPLLETEATELADLYAKLSTSEHDDARNAYVNTDKATFQARYDKILAIESAVLGRRV